MKRISPIILFLLLFYSCASAQEKKIIPGYAGYAVPAEKEDDRYPISFNEKAGAVNWMNTAQHLEYWFYCPNTGSMNIAIELSNSAASASKLLVKIAADSFIVDVPKKAVHQKVEVGTISITRPGTYNIQIFSAVRSNSKTMAVINSLLLSGNAAKSIWFNSKPRRNAASVHLFYPLPDTVKAVGFYNRVTVPSGADHLYSYYMACGFARGYFGMQVNGEHERRIIFSVWDAGNEAADRSKVTEENRVLLWAKGKDVVAGSFGDEGTGGHSHWLYNWKAGQAYDFYVTALPDSATATTIYTAYFFIPELMQWKMIASFKAPKDGKYLDHLYSFNEDFSGANGQLKRKAYFSDQWIKNESGEWKELLNAKFSTDATGKSGDRTDIGGGVEGNTFYLWNGGFEPGNTKPGDMFKRMAVNEKPVIDFYNNADSIVEFNLEKQFIDDAVTAGKIDTTGSINGVYFKILKEGKGNYVKTTDTVVAFYKGSLLNGQIFDQTKEKPATFPLSRLIKGWQVGLSKIKVGGKIQLIIPSALAYSIRARSSKIPPNSILIFEIEVVSVK